METTQNNDKLTRLFVQSVGIILCLTAIAKLVSAGGSARILNLPDPLLILSNKIVLVLVAVMELVIAGFALFSKKINLALYLIAWFASNLLIYRLGLWWSKVAAPCSCLGTVTDALPFSPHTIQLMMKCILGYMLIGSFGLLLRGFFSGRNKPAASATPVEAQS